MSLTLDNASVILVNGIKENYSIIVNNDGKIEFVGPKESKPKVKGEIIDLQNLYVSPGFINVHTHGGFGVTFGRGDLLAEMTKYSKWAAGNGVAGYLCSIAAQDSQKLSGLIKQYVDIFSDSSLEVQGALCRGLHLEGPFLSREKKGAFNPDWLRMPNVSEASDYISSGKGWIKQVTIAPELENSDEVAELFNRNNIRVALGHSNTSYDLASNALKHSFTHITHTYNAQSSLNHRAPGVVGAVLTSSDATAEIISDLVHVHPAAIKVLVDCIGVGRVIIITDAMTAAGLRDGKYSMVGEEVTVKDRIARLDDGTLAGGTSTMKDCVKNMIKQVGVSLVDAINMASLNPAGLIGESEHMGSIEVGKDASLVVIDDDINVFLNIVNGKIVFDELPG